MGQLQHCVYAVRIDYRGVACVATTATVGGLWFVVAGLDPVLVCHITHVPTATSPSSTKYMPPRPSSSACATPATSAPCPAPTPQNTRGGCCDPHQRALAALRNPLAPAAARRAARRGHPLSAPTAPQSGHHGGHHTAQRHERRHDAYAVDDGPARPHQPADRRREEARRAALAPG